MFTAVKRWWGWVTERRRVIQHLHSQHAWLTEKIRSYDSDSMVHRCAQARLHEIQELHKIITGQVCQKLQQDAQKALRSRKAMEADETI